MVCSGAAPRVPTEWGSERASRASHAPAFAPKGASARSRRSFSGGGNEAPTVAPQRQTWSDGWLERACRGVRGAKPLDESEAETRAEMEARSAAVERMRDVEVQADNRDAQPEAGTRAAQLTLVGEPLTVGGRHAAVHEHVEPHAPARERGGEGNPCLGGPEEPLVACERAGVEAADRRTP